MSVIFLTDPCARGLILDYLCPLTLLNVAFSLHLQLWNVWSSSVQGIFRLSYIMCSCSLYEEGEPKILLLSHLYLFSFGFFLKMNSFILKKKLLIYAIGII